MVNAGAPGQSQASHVSSFEHSKESLKPFSNSCMRVCVAGNSPRWVEIKVRFIVVWSDGLPLFPGNAGQVLREACQEFG